MIDRAAINAGPLVALSLLDELFSSAGPPACAEHGHHSYSSKGKTH